MILPEVNPLEKESVINELKKLIEKYKEKLKFKSWYFRNFYYFWLGIFLIILISFIFYLLVLSIIIFNILMIFSIVALTLSSITFLFNMMDYPVDNLNIYRLKIDENYYELNISIKNSGHGKLKLNFAIYFIESIDKDTELTSFLQCDTETMDQYLDELISRIEHNVINLYSLDFITKNYNVFFTRNDTHTETRIHKFDDGKIYMITFLFQTTHKVFYYISKYLKT